MDIITQSMLDIQPVDWLGLHHDCLHDGEIEVLGALGRSVNARTMIEFGCRDGRTAHLLIRHVPTLKQYIGVDVPTTYQSPLPFQNDYIVPMPGKYARNDSEFTLVIRDRGSLDLTVDDLPLSDVVFIDGDHSACVVEHDSLLARDVVRDGGLIIWHDYKDDPLIDVRKTVDRLAADGWQIHHVEGTWLAVHRKRPQ